jgi:uncharacterized membrane protein
MARSASKLSPPSNSLGSELQGPPLSESVAPQVRPFDTPAATQDKHWAVLGLLASLLLLFILAPWPLLDKLRALCFGICPQRPSHSYFLAGAQLPLEARKTGIYSGFLLTWGALVALGRGRAAQLPPAPLLVALTGFIGLMGLDGTHALFYDIGLPHLYTPDSRLRLATGLLAGVAIAAIVWPIFNFTFWRDGKDQPSLAGPGELLVALAVCVPLFAVVVLGFDLALYPVALLSVAGMASLVTLLNLVVVLIVTRREGVATSSWDVLVPILLALILAAGELGALSLLRFMVFGTAALP